MSEQSVPVVGIIGLGAVGGSLARALVVRGVRVRGAAASADDRRQAAMIGVEIAAGPAELVAGPDAPGLVVVAAPLASLGGIVAALLPRLAPDAVVLHAAPLQREDATALDDAATERVIGTHPFVGAEGTGFAASRPDLFAGATVFAEARAGAVERSRLEWLWRTVAGAAEIVYRTAETHDAAMAWTSHLPQLAATALAVALGVAGVPASTAGAGLHGATHPAASPLELWRDLLRAAPPETGDALALLSRVVDQLREAHASGDDVRLAELWERGRAWREAAGEAAVAAPDTSSRSVGLSAVGSRLSAARRSRSTVDC